MLLNLVIVIVITLFLYKDTIATPSWSLTTVKSKSLMHKLNDTGFVSRIISFRGGKPSIEVSPDDSTSSSSNSENIFGPVKSSNPLVNQLYEQFEQAKDIDEIFEIMEEVSRKFTCC